MATWTTSIKPGALPEGGPIGLLLALTYPGSLDNVTWTDSTKHSATFSSPTKTATVEEGMPLGLLLTLTAGESSLNNITWSNQSKN